MNGFAVLRPGVLSLLQDHGRFGQQHLGLSNGGPSDPVAHHWANALLQNPRQATTIEISAGGLVLQSRVRTEIAVCGADMPLTINGKPLALWQGHTVHVGDMIKLGYAQTGMRSYLAVREGFSIPAQFASTATVVRERIGGIDGQALHAGSWLPCNAHDTSLLLRASAEAIPHYTRSLTLRLVPGYQYAAFSKAALRQLLEGHFEVSARSDRMAYQLSGPAISAPQNGIVSEGNCLGAVQVPPDGTPYILLNDRQTIGGYPKLGAILSADCAQLAQCQAGSQIRFQLIDIDKAQHLLLDHAQAQKKNLHKILA